MFDLLLKILGNPNDREIKKIQPVVEAVNVYEEQFARMSDEELSRVTIDFRNKYNARPKSRNPEKDRIHSEEALEYLLPEAFAAVREVGKRTLNMRHFDVQIIGGYILHKGMISEMRTGEGKTLVATLPAYLNALTGKGVHIVTVNDYLAKRDSEWMGYIFKFLGLDVGLITMAKQSWDDFSAKKIAYDADVTYGTNNEFGFDYLRDNMAGSIEQCVQRPYNYAIVDEVDSILIDEARTPLIISGRLERSAELYNTMAKLAPTLEPKLDYEVEEKTKNIILTEEGIDKAMEFLNSDDLYDPSTQYAHYVIQALRAKELFKKDIDYVVKDGQVVIVDEFTGRLMDGRRWSDGLHQSIEAKEKLRIQDESQTLASITFQNLFRLYPKLAGMTGTALTEEAEFGKIYKLKVLSVPTNRNDIRKDLPDVVYKGVKNKFEAVVEDIIEKHHEGRPVLVGTISIENSEILSEMLKKKNIKHNVLNAKHHEREAQIIAQAGRLKAITIATNMAGRGTDILLGGNPEFLAKEMLEKDGINSEEMEDKDYKKISQEYLQKAYQICDDEHKQVVDVGGLYVLGTERHESRRIDNQLRGRAARQGDPGSTRFYLSLEDNLMRLFGGDKIYNIMETLNVDETMAIDAPIISGSIERAQKKVEAHHFDIRKHVLEYDDVMNKQRELFYHERRKSLEGENLKDDIIYMIEREVERIAGSHINKDMPYEEWEAGALDSILKALQAQIPQISYLEVADLRGLKYEPLMLKIIKEAVNTYNEHEKNIVDFYNTMVIPQTSGEPQLFDDKNNIMRELERDTLLRIADKKWIDHLHNIDAVRDGIGLRAYGQKDPLIEYKREAFELFNDLIQDIQRETISTLFRTKFQVQLVNIHDEEEIETDLTRSRKTAKTSAVEEEHDLEVIAEEGKKIGRNEPCPCGSGLKHKRCCGKVLSKGK
ncbi:MAG: preprotein translocase subunit SecA [Cyanobacteriota bacterium]